MGDFAGLTSSKKYTIVTTTDQRYTDSFNDSRSATDVTSNTGNTTITLPSPVGEKYLPLILISALALAAVVVVANLFKSS